MKELLTLLAEKFNVPGKFEDYTQITMGHINSTYQVTIGGVEYIMQKINKNVFKKPEIVMENIDLVTKYIRNVSPSESLELMYTSDGLAYYVVDGEYYRCYKYVPGVVYNGDMTEDAMYAAGLGFGKFQCLLADFDASKLNDTIPFFHATDKRYENLENAIKNDIKGRAKEVEAEINAYAALKDEALIIANMVKEGKLKNHVTHNDTKTNNVVLDATGHPVCVIDLDTVMPGLIAHDFGDSMRFGANTASESEQDLSKVNLSLTLFKAYAKGFISQVAKVLTKEELDTLSLGALTMTFECGIRFLTDYLEGDTYFKVQYPTHNLVRCRTQLKLAQEMSKHMQEMNDIVYEIYNQYK